MPTAPSSFLLLVPNWHLTSNVNKGISRHWKITGAYILNLAEILWNIYPKFSCLFIVTFLFICSYWGASFCQPARLVCSYSVKTSAFSMSRPSYNFHKYHKYTILEVFICLFSSLKAYLNHFRVTCSTIGSTSAATSLAARNWGCAFWVTLTPYQVTCCCSLLNRYSPISSNILVKWTRIGAVQVASLPFSS